ncbi:type III pantothenate kinase [Thermus scotoductus]|jgi:type III pantothenate kinase|uniref:Type III pantothenate kinase n=1 Tax=Thermus scotoductus TaxID=37636 RepID=A0A430QZL9_THESC|nr:MULTISPECIES: type III pantothenate kinase [Thermus]RTG93807.1 type III pantothenate kinase [Thermus scotoductus]RTG96470.1 type III pantothenate kinase [Thermus scotoductus]RTG98797.1 type III pantothenate kinase [Thermus scotoductus]RTH00591.1 type III pantothenate kinase [Thermus scotoductus]RTH01880.1 type III pantothenate kinase [Thermus scotoductus]
MLLAIDIGNTSTALGVFSGEELVAHFRIHTDRMRMESEYRVMLRNLFALENLPPPNAALLSSVVPPVEREMKEAIEKLFSIKAQVVDAGATGLEVCIDNPKEAGTDRLVNAVGALGYESPTGRYIVVDFGTATTFDLVEAPNRYLGGAITIGPQTAADALAARTAKLPRIDLVPPTQVVGKNTLDALRSGLVLGYAALVEGMVRRFKEEAGEALVIATGGFAETLRDLCPSFDVVDEDLTLKGLLRIHKGQG